ncbi:glycosyltransferase family 2 protein [Acidihalobacter prosperus]|uniref:Glycosyltransferase 2-like domain-containing protein n=1 Tax=Acidihalobacter prosperus TaxID=160660 RepID=A0A1A6C4E0_9GAMM|nr:glycosyltransferase family 2 protein [Acidihalobacter prosperus]OBS09419.1 hypothetical protein Thpro_021747 [Acidihalobacter prosperus]
MKVFAVIPAYNEVRTLSELVAGARAHVDHVVVVDDGSSDGTAESLQPLPDGVTLLRNAGNRGKAAALWRGFRHALEAGATHVVTLDADGQHRPEDIPRLLAALKPDDDALILGERRDKRATAPRMRRFANAFADFWISLAAGQRLRDSQSGFRVYPVGLLSTLHFVERRRKSFVFETELLVAAVYGGFAIRYVDIASLYLHDARASHYRAVYDTTQIVIVVAGMLLDPRLALPRLRHLIRGLVRARQRASAAPTRE